MNRLAIIVTVSIAILLTACQETKEEITNPLSEKDIARTVGEQIPFEAGMQWISYHQKNSGSARLDSLLDFNVPAATIKLMLSSVNNLVGVAFHHAIDDFGITHILVIPVNESLELWSSTPGRLIIDANTGTEIPQELAKVWTDNFKRAHPSDVWFHFFGKDIFDEMQALPYFTNVDIEPATRPEDLSPQLLLIIWDERSTISGRTEDDPGTVYDASNPCPPCPTN